WAAAQVGLGGALFRLGERESETAHLTAAGAAYQAALEEYTRDGGALDWGGTQDNLGTALARLGGGGTGRGSGKRGWPASTWRCGLPGGAGGREGRAGAARLGGNAG